MTTSNTTVKKQMKTLHLDLEFWKWGKKEKKILAVNLLHSSSFVVGTGRNHVSIGNKNVVKEQIKSDWHLNSPYNITSESHIVVTGVKEMTTN